MMDIQIVEQFKYEQRDTLNCQACKQKTLIYRLHIAELVMRQAGVFCKDTTPEEIYQFAIRNIEDREYCYLCLMEKIRKS
jgi:hypothetical protein